MGYPVEALAELARYERLLQQVARGLWKDENPARVRAPRNFKNSLRLRLVAVEPGCVIPVLEREQRGGEPGQLFTTPDVWIERSAHAIADAIAAVGEGRVPPDFPKDALDGLESFGSGLREDEEVVMDRNGAGDVVYSQRVRHSLISLRHEHVVEISGELIGRLSEIDADKQGFQFTDRSGVKVPGTFSRRGLFTSIKGATDRTQEAPFVRLTCTYLTDLQSNVTSVQDVDEVEVLVGADDRLGPRLRELLALPRNWRDGDGLPPNVEAIEWVRDFAAEIEEDEASGLSLFPTLDGGVLVERQIGPRRWSLEVNEDGEVSVTIAGEEGSGVLDVSDSASAVTSLQTFVHA